MYIVTTSSPTPPIALMTWSNSVTLTMLSNMSIAEFKSAIKTDSLSVVKNPKTGKLFVSAGNANYKCQQDIDLNGKMEFLISDGVIADACLINSNSQNVLATL